MQKEEIANIFIQDYDYTLPEHLIAQYPLQNRDDARLLVYKNDCITDTVVKNIKNYLSDNAFLIFNNTKVIPARLHVQKDTGAWLEIFLLEPADVHGGYTKALYNKKHSKWRCLIGNAKRWKNDILNIKINYNNSDFILSVEKLDVFKDYFEIEFRWEADVVFSEVLLQIGKTPLPPYIQRSAEVEDQGRYQTIYAKYEGSVAAPTAGLHFTLPLIQELKDNNILMDEIILHVGAGTFKPVSSNTVAGHVMHEEYIVFSKTNIENLIQHLDKKITAVGTTSCRALESLYWLGVKLINGYQFEECFIIGQWEPYENNTNLPDAKMALNAVKTYMTVCKLENICGFTQIIIIPGYVFKLIKALVTNFHQPQSTLLLLIAALIGDAWRKVYSHAIQYQYRFFSYGDACLFELGA